MKRAGHEISLTKLPLQRRVICNSSTFQFRFVLPLTFAILHYKSVYILCFTNITFNNENNPHVQNFHRLYGVILVKL